MKLFISYARVDKLVCKEIVERLEEAHEVWYDKRLHAGQAWWEEICAKLEWCDGFIYLLSQDSVSSKYCKDECALALQANKSIFPVVIRRTDIPDNLKHLQYADLSEDLNKIPSLLNAITITERSLLSKHPKHQPLPSMIKIPLQEMSPSEALKQAAEAMEENNFDHAAFIIKGALEKNPDTFTKKMLSTLLVDAEMGLERMASQLTAERAYALILELVKRKVTRSSGCEAFLEFRKEFPDHDPDNIASICGDALPFSESKKTALALKRARNFEGKRNDDWKPYVTQFSDLKIADMLFCLVPVGVFHMGSTDGDTNETPVREREIEQPYWISQYSVTNAQWKRAVADDVVKPPRTEQAIQWYNDPAMANAPVVGIDWFMARDFASWLGARLPTELEWEYAARGIESWRYPWGNDWRQSVPVWSTNSDNKPHPVATKPEGKSWVDAYHMIGNVWEWTNSLYKQYPYRGNDGRERDTGKSTEVMRILRGGGWGSSNPNTLRAACRLDGSPINTSDYWGFRLVRSQELETK